MAQGRCAAHAREQRTRYEQQRPSAAERDYGARWRKIRNAFIAEFPNCVLCGAPATDVDHRVSRRNGGTDDWGNLVSYCHTHHSSKTAKEDGGWGNK